MSTELPVSVWATAQRTAKAQRAERYLELSANHPAKMLPAIAAQAIATYSQPGDLVLDPMCGIGTTLVEAVRQGRDAIGVEYEPQWADLAWANLELAKRNGGTGHGQVISGDARHVATLVDPAARGLVALVVTSPPYGASVHGQVRARPGHGVAKSHNRYSTDPANLAHIGHRRLLEATGQILANLARLLRPGGIIAMTVRPYRHTGYLVDLPGQLSALAGPVGLLLYERDVALLAGLRDDHLVPRSSFFALEQARKARLRGETRLVIAHEDLLIFRKPSRSAPARRP